MQVVVFSNDGSENIKTARTPVHTEDKPIAEPREHAAVYRREHHIAHGCVGIQRPRQIEEEGEDRRTDDDVDGICLPHQTPCHKEQRDIIDECLQTDGQPEDIIDDHCDAGCTTCEEMCRNEEKVDRTACNEAAERDSGIAHDAVSEHAHMQIMRHLT